MSSDAEEETRTDRKRRVESVVGTIRKNTGGPEQANDQRPGMRIAHIKGNFSLRGEAPVWWLVRGLVHHGESVAEPAAVEVTGPPPRPVARLAVGAFVPEECVDESSDHRPITHSGRRPSLAVRSASNARPQEWQR